MNKCVFLDRDGVLNQDLDGYLFKPDDLEIPEGVAEGLQQLKAAGFLLIVVTNQAGIAKKLYTVADVWKVHVRIQEMTGVALDDLYFSPHHPEYSTRSLTRKPESLLIEKAMAKYNIKAGDSWMIGDRERDVQAGNKAGLHTIHLTNILPKETIANHTVSSFREAVNIITGNPTL